MDHRSQQILRAKLVSYQGRFTLVLGKEKFVFLNGKLEEYSRYVNTLTPEEIELIK